MLAQQLMTLDHVELSHLHAGDSTPLATGTLSLALVTVPVQQQSMPGAFSQEKEKLSAPPPIPPRPSSPSRSPSPSGTTDEWLLLTMTAGGDEEPLFEMPVPSSSRIITQPPSSYIIPNSSTGAEGLNDEAAGFIKVTLPASIDSEHREAFESILWGLTSFSTGAVPTTTGATPPSYADPSLRSKLVLVDDHGAVLGSLPSSAIAEDPSLSAEGQGEHEKEPVIIEPTTSAPGSTSHFDFTARPLSEWTPTPNPTSSRIIDAGDWISRGVVVGAEVLGRAFEAGADKWVASRPATEKPMVFSPSTSKSVATGNLYTGKAVVVSGKAAAMIGSMASSVGDRVGKTLGIQNKPDGKPPKGVKGLIIRSLVAFISVTDSLETGGKHLLASGSKSTTQVVNHSYGAEAAAAAAKVGGSVQHVALVYIDARGVTRKALLKSVGKSAIRAKMADGREVILSDDGQKLQMQSATGEAVPAGYGAGAQEKQKLA